LASNSGDSSSSRDLTSQPPMQNLSTDNSANWVPGWRPFHTSLQVYSSQADFQLTNKLSHSPTSYFMSLHSTKLLTALNSRTQLTMPITFRHEPHRKHRFHCYSPTIP
jgi:hypothetical protein